MCARVCIQIHTCVCVLTMIPFLSPSPSSSSSLLSVYLRWCPSCRSAGEPARTHDSTPLVSRRSYKLNAGRRRTVTSTNRTMIHLSSNIRYISVSPYCFLSPLSHSPPPPLLVLFFPHQFSHSLTLLHSFSPFLTCISHSLFFSLFLIASIFYIHKV